MPLHGDTGQTTQERQRAVGAPTHRHTWQVCHDGTPHRPKASIISVSYKNRNIGRNVFPLNGSSFIITMLVNKILMSFQTFKII